MNVNTPSANNRLEFRVDDSPLWSVSAGTDLLVNSEPGVLRLAIKGGAGANAGFVGIGTVAPGDKLDVQGDIRVGTSGTNGCLKDDDGGTIVGTCTSDALLKKDIAQFENVLTRLAALQPVFFNWRADEFPDLYLGGERSFGLVAQEVEQVFPDMVTTDERGYKAVRYHMLPLLLTQGIRELQAEGEVLSARAATAETENQRLRGQVADLEARLAGIEQQLNGGTAPVVAVR
jgi:hypothetical protein